MRESNEQRYTRMTEMERPLWRAGKTVCGLDEVGRGPLAGPVVVACVVLAEPPIYGVNDSKKLSETRRNTLFERISEYGSFGLGILDAETIDRVNILEATRRAFLLAYENLGRHCDIALCDMVHGLKMPLEQRVMVKGDATSYLVAAASIVAKVTRDRLMAQWDEIYPAYGFKQNKGYGTAAHIAALKEHGACPLHRKSFLKAILP